MVREKKTPYPALSNAKPIPGTIGIVLVCTLLIVANSLAWLWALAEFADQRTLLGAAILAYTFGLRHAIDGDHITAIDHTTRKKSQTAERVMVGSLFFTMGHSMMVLIGMVSVTATAMTLSRCFQQFETVSGLIATGTSAVVILGIAIVNLAIFSYVWMRFIRMYRTGTINPQNLRHKSPFHSPIYRRLHIFDVDPLQVIFRLGLGGVTEVILLGTLSAQAAKHGSMLSCLVLPTLFTVALVLIDTTDGMPISYACTRVLGNPLRRISFCLAVTVVSALVIFFVLGGATIGSLPDVVQRYGSRWLTVGKFNHLLIAIDHVALCFFVLSLVISAQACRMEYRCQGG